MIGPVVFVSAVALCSSSAAGELPRRTTLSDATLEHIVPDQPYVRLSRGDVDAVIVDNRAVDDQVLAQHRAGYSGAAS